MRKVPSGCCRSASATPARPSPVAHHGGPFAPAKADGAAAPLPSSRRGQTACCASTACSTAAEAGGRCSAPPPPSLLLALSIRVVLPILVLHIKRFLYNSYCRDKLTTSISFPLESLDLSPYGSGLHLSSVAPVVTRASARAQNSADRIAERRAVAARPGRASGPQVAPRLTPRRGADVVPRARKGMLADTLDGDGKKKKKDKKAKKAAKTAGSGTGGSDSIAGSLEPAFAGSKPSTRPSGKNWIEVGNVTADFKTKPIKPLVLANGNFILVKWEDLVFCADCNSTAYQYPLIDGELFFGAGGPAIRSPLDGTEYDLTTGAVITWCPKNNPIRKALGTLKAAAEPVPLPVYPTRMEADGSVLTNFVDKVEVKTGFSNDAAGSMQGGKGVEIAVKAEDGSGADDAAPATSPASPAPPAEENAVSPAILVGIGLVALATVYLQVSSGGDVPAPPQ